LFFLFKHFAAWWPIKKTNILLAFSCSFPVLGSNGPRQRQSRAPPFSTASENNQTKKLELSHDGMANLWNRNYAYSSLRYGNSAGRHLDGVGFDSGLGTSHGFGTDVGVANSDGINRGRR
jgi:hypothetical protein